MICPHCQQTHPEGTKFCPFTAREIPQSTHSTGVIDAVRGFWSQLIEKAGLPSLVTGLVGTVLFVVGLCGLLGQLAFETALGWIGPFSDTGGLETATAPGYSGTALLTPAPTNVMGLSNAARTQTALAGKPVSQLPSPTFSITPTRNPLPTYTSTITPVPTHTRTAAPSKLFSGWIAYVYGEDNLREVYLMNPTTGETRQVTRNDYSEEWPSFSPDNRSIAYASYRQDNWQIYVTDLVNGGEKQITHFNGQARYPQWSPTAGSKQVLFEGRVGSPGNYEINIFLVDVASLDVRQVTFSDADSRPRWSPDGTMMVVGRALADTDHDGSIHSSDSLDPFLVEIESGQETHFINSPGSDDFQFAWSPDGQTIAISSVRGDVDGNGFINLDDAQGLYLFDVDSGSENYLALNGLHIFSPDYSPDGSKLVMIADVGTSSEIWIYDFKSSELKRISSSGPYYHTEWAN